MTKLYLAKHEITLKIYTDATSTPQTIVIKDGVYKKQTYASLLLFEGNVMLEGDNITVLSIEAKAVVVQIESTIMKLANLLENKNIYIEGIKAIPEGKERELLEAII